jgi:uncharacterized protein (TIGR02145 family)
MRYILFYSLLSIVCQSASAQNGTIKDIDGNVYKTVKIGTQVWMAQNLKTAHYRDGSPIMEIELKAPWANNSKYNGAWCYYQSDSGNNPTYGKLYNWYAVADTRRLCPTGWHVPSDSEWTVLTDYMGGEAGAGDKMKANKLWNFGPNYVPNDSFGFTALPAGIRYFDGDFSYLGSDSNFWPSTESESDSSKAWGRNLMVDDIGIGRLDFDKADGLSVRCVGD